MNRIALALTVAAVATSAAAQSNRKQTTWDDLLKPVEVKTNPAIPLAPPQSAAQSTPTVRFVTPQPIAKPAQPMPAAIDFAAERLRNFQGQVERGGYGCPSIVSANTLGDDEYGRPEFLVACATATRGLFYRVVFPPTGPAIVRPDKF